MIAARSVTVQFTHERKGATRGDAQTRASAPPSSRAAEGSRPGPILFRPPGFGYDALAPERGVRIRTRARLSPRSGAGYLAAETHGSAPWAIIFRPPGSVRSARSAACGLPRCAGGAAAATAHSHLRFAERARAHALQGHDGLRFRREIGRAHV